MLLKATQYANFSDRLAATTRKGQNQAWLGVFESFDSVGTSGDVGGRREGIDSTIDGTMMQILTVAFAKALRHWLSKSDWQTRIFHGDLQRSY